MHVPAVYKGVQLNDFLVKGGFVKCAGRREAPGARCFPWHIPARAGGLLCLPWRYVKLPTCLHPGSVRYGMDPTEPICSGSLAAAKEKFSGGHS